MTEELEIETIEEEQEEVAAEKRVQEIATHKLTKIKYKVFRSALYAQLSPIEDAVDSVQVPLGQLKTDYNLSTREI